MRCSLLNVPNVGTSSRNSFSVVSTFSGCGGSSLGYQLAGGKVRLAVEWDKNAVETYRLNFPDTPIYHGDIAALSVDECCKLADIEPGELDILDGSPPCQGFSTAGKRKAQGKPMTVQEVIGHLPLGQQGKHEPQVLEAWHKSKPGQSLRKASRYVGSFQSCRLAPNKPSMTQIKSRRHWHYVVPRQLTDLECSLVASFPATYRWVGTRQCITNRIGNSVPPNFMRAIAEHIRDEILAKVEV